MTNHARRTLAAVAAGLLLLAAAPARALDAATLPVGSVAPDFQSVDVEGQPFTLSEALKQGPAVLVFWSIFCGTCRDELPILEQEKPKYADKVQFFTVNLDEAQRAKTVKGFAKQQGFTFRMLLNKVEGKEFLIDQAYQVKATPALYLVNRDGTIAYGHYGALNPEELAGVVALAK
ncbi:MAG: TlpA family protein disulfide reductase [Deltaproteobacteria bacterium]|nr:TlpA family protein disulfide reductase [Deltaproteobacteria bacterium]